MKMLEPLQVRGMKLRNRIVMAPMETNMGVRNRRARAYYAERAKGGAGLITIAGTSLDLYISDDAWGKPGAAASFVGGLRTLAEDVHKAGAKLGAQIFHLNRLPSGLGLYDERGEAIAPSYREDIARDAGSSILVKKGLVKKSPCRELTIPEIKLIISKFAQAAAAVRDANFDMVELHSAHGYMPSQFFSPADNRRADEYGGSLEGRARFGVECVQAMRAAVGDDFAIFVRIPGYEYRKGGATTDECAQFAALLEKAGADVISVSVGGTDRLRGYANYVAPSPEFPLGCYADLAEAVKKKVRVPVATAGRIHTPEIAETILHQGKADLLILGRQLIADPYWVEKVASGRAVDIVPCQSCNTCIEAVAGQTDFRCAVNAAAGKESQYTITAAEKARKAWIIGGGPAGMEAARVAALRGHQVTLFDKNVTLGGQLLDAALPPHKRVIAKLNQYLARQLDKNGVEVKLHQEVTPDFVAAGKPDAVVVAVGAVPVTLSIPGANGKNVALATEILRGDRQAGQRVVVVGGGMVGCETAEFLVQKGKKVTIVEMLDEIGADMATVPKVLTQDRLGEAGVTVETSSEVEAITAKGVRATRNGRPVTFRGDTVVLAVGMRPVAGMAEALRGKISQVYAVGDCVKPRKIVDAIAEGNQVGREI